MGEYPVGATATTFRVIAALRESGGAGVTDLAERLDLSKSAVHNHLATLERLEFAVNDGGTYRLGLRFLAVGADARDGMAVVTAGREAVDALAERTGETASLVVPEFGEAVYAHTIPDAPADGVRVGRRVPLHASAPGKAILACLPDADVRAYLDDRPLAGLTDRTITDAAALRSELRSVDDRGLAFDRGEAFEGVRSVAAPVRRGDDVVAAVSVSGPATRLSGKRLEEDLPGLVLSHAKDLELALAE